MAEAADQTQKLSIGKRKSGKLKTENNFKIIETQIQTDRGQQAQDKEAKGNKPITLGFFFFFFLPRSKPLSVQ